MRPPLTLLHPHQGEAQKLKTGKEALSPEGEAQKLKRSCEAEDRGSLGGEYQSQQLSAGDSPKDSDHRKKVNAGDDGAQGRTAAAAFKSSPGEQQWSSSGRNNLIKQEKGNEISGKM